MYQLLPHVIVALFLSTTAALAWDPWGDITHPDRIIRNVGRETGKAVNDIPNIPRNVGREVNNVGREIDRMRREVDVQAAAPLFAQWLQQSRNDAMRGGVSPIPPFIRQQLQGFYDNDVLNRARFKIGDGGIFNLANLSIHYGDANAVTLIDVIVFSNPAGVNDPVLWAHELKHVQQYRDWGVRDFAIRYLRSWNGVEGDAYAAQNSFAQRRQVAQSYPPPPQPYPGQPYMSQNCATPQGMCPMMQPLPAGSQCYCQTYMGPIYGQVQ